MANKNTNMILAVAVIAVCAIAIIGVGYAYTATTENAGNTVNTKYITLSQSAYADSFDKEVKYDTINPNGAITYTIHSNTAIYEDGPKGVELGSTTITVGKSTNNIDSFKFSVTKLDTPEGAIMVENGFYIGISVNNGTEVIRSFDVSHPNYYKTGTDDHAAAISDGSDISLAEVTTIPITVKMYYAPDAITGTLNQPLKDVTFEFKAEAPDA